MSFLTQRDADPHGGGENLKTIEVANRWPAEYDHQSRVDCCFRKNLQRHCQGGRDEANFERFALRA